METSREIEKKYSEIAGEYENYYPLHYRQGIMDHRQQNQQIFIRLSSNTDEISGDTNAEIKTVS